MIDKTKNLRFLHEKVFADFSCREAYLVIALIRNIEEWLKTYLSLLKPQNCKI